MDQPAATPYHRLARLRPPWCRWWRPILTVFVALVAYTVLASLLMVGSVLALSLANSPREIGQVLGDPRSPLDVFLALAFAALLVPSALLGVRLGGWRPTTLLLSVTGRVRWELLRGSAPVVLVVLALAAALPLIIGGAGVPAGTSTGQLVAVVALILVLSPLQALGEELAFRGLGQQAIGTWLRSPVWAILLPVPCELIGRGYAGGSLVGAAVLGVCCGILAWKSGGLELPVLLHLAVLAPLQIAAAFGGPTHAGGPVMIAAILVVTLGLVVWLDRRDRLAAREPVTRAADAPLPALLRV